MLKDLNMGNWYSWIICAVLLGIGLVFLVKFSDLFVSAASSIAKKFHISPLVIGLTIVAMGTSLPELAVSASDSVTCLIKGGNANVAIGNVVGSNIANLLLILGFCALFSPIYVKKSVCKKEFPILIFVSLILSLFGILFSLNGQYAILRWEAIILVVLIIAYMMYIVFDAKKQKQSFSLQEEKDEIKVMATWKAIIFVIIGVLGIVLGGEAVVYGAKNIAIGIGDVANLNHDLVESLVGLTIVAIGTSLPELVTSIVAAKKGQVDMALGNVMGSNIFNILFVLGISGVISPLTVGVQIVIDLIMMMIATILVFVFALKGKLGKKEGFVLLAFYFAYLVYLILRTLI